MSDQRRLNPEPGGIAAGLPWDPYWDGPGEGPLHLSDKFLTPEGGFEKADPSLYPKFGEPVVIEPLVDGDVPCPFVDNPWPLGFMDGPANVALASGPLVLTHPSGVRETALWLSCWEEGTEWWVGYLTVERYRSWTSTGITSVPEGFDILKIGEEGVVEVRPSEVPYELLRDNALWNGPHEYVWRETRWELDSPSESWPCPPDR